MAGTKELGDIPDYWATQLKMYGDYLQTISYDHVGNHYDSFVCYDRDTQEGNISWMVNPVPWNDSLWNQVRYQAYSWGFAIINIHIM